MTEEPYQHYFAQRDFQPGEEEILKTKRYDMAMDPREWMARNGHRIICGDSRRYVFTDKELETWVYAAYEALSQEGLPKLWKEFLTPEEMRNAKEHYENP